MLSKESIDYPLALQMICKSRNQSIYALSKHIGINPQTLVFILEGQRKPYSRCKDILYQLAIDTGVINHPEIDTRKVYA